ncbi:hypothetical protein [Maioricimonas sp. JC845]|uniref:hypothetical protein n=1 Tax=Maioricimonas sp. JC845 TaxID=3232138 RepID=UPI00345B3B9B
MEVLREIRETSTQAVLFGGTLRSLLISRLEHSRAGRPRDIDIVVSGTSIEGIRNKFRRQIARETRFGGLQLVHGEWQFDIWPLEKTWAFVADGVEAPDFSALPGTTFFNLEAVAVDVWPAPGQARNVYSGDNQFFHGILSRTLEINREHNPYPELCIVRAMVFADSLKFNIGPRLARYISTYGPDIPPRDLEAVQLAHYGTIRHRGPSLFRWIEQVSELQVLHPDTVIRVPHVCRQSLSGD